MKASKLRALQRTRQKSAAWTYVYPFGEPYYLLNPDLTPEQFNQCEAARTYTE